VAKGDGGASTCFVGAKGTASGSSTEADTRDPGSTSTSVYAKKLFEAFSGIPTAILLEAVATRLAVERQTGARRAKTSR